MVAIRRGLLIFSIVVLMGVLGTLATFFWKTYDLQYLSARIEYLGKFGGLQTVEGASEASLVYEYTLLGRRTVAVPAENPLKDYATSSFGSAALTFEPESSRMQVVLLGDTPRVLVDDETLKTSISISTGGLIAYAALIPAFNRAEILGNVAEFYSPNYWRVIQVDLTGSTTQISTGMAPRFFRYDGDPYLLVTDAGRIRIIPLRQGGAHLELPAMTSGRWPAEIAQDGKYLALFNMTDETYEVYALSREDEMFALVKIPLSANKLVRVGFSNDKLVAISLPSAQPADIPQLEVIDLVRDGATEALYSDSALLDTTKIVVP